MTTPEGMTDTWQPGTIPPPPPGPPAYAPTSRPVSPYVVGTGAGRRAAPSRQLLAALTAAVVVAGGTGWWLTRGGSVAAPPRPAAAAPTTAARTAATSAPLGAAPTSGLDLGGSPELAAALPQIEQFVEQARGLRFKHAVPATPLSDKAFVAALLKGDAGAPSQDGLYSSMKALHLIPAGLDTSAPETAASVADVGGFYDPRTKHLYVRGTVLNPLTQSILAHELTHALDDQYFDLQSVQRKGKNLDAAEAIDSLVEGDARSVENRFNAALTAPRKAQEDAERSAYLAHETVAPGDVPDPFVFELWSLFPYELGSVFVGALGDAGGQTQVDKAFAAPPTTTMQVLDPDGSYLQRVPPVTVAAPAAPKGSRVLDTDTLGVLGLASVMAEGAPIDWDSQTEVEGWRGDRFVTTQAGTHTCVRDSIRLSSPATRLTLQKSLQHWASGHSGSSVAQTSATGLLLVSCG